MFYYIPRTNQEPAPLNAISTMDPAEAAGERRARHLRMLRELADMAMELAKLAAAQARAALAADPLPSATEPEAAARTRRPPPRTTDPTVLFIRLSGAAQQAMALEARLAGEPPAGRTKMQPASCKTLRADPRWNTIREIIKIATEKSPDRRELQREAEAKLSEALQADPEQTATTAETLKTICEDVGIEINHHTLPTDLLITLLPPGVSPDDPIDHLLPPDWAPVDHLRRARREATGPP
jgi:hypothetical protein